MSELTRVAQKIIRNLKERDIKILKSLYDLRCLTCEQIFELHFSEHKNQNYCKKRLKYLVKENVITERILNNYTTCYFLKTNGINIIKYSYLLSDAVYDKDKNIISRGYFTAGELNLKDKHINHQLHLNQFYIDLLNLKTNVYLNYRDSSHAEKFPHVIPDGILDLFGISFFIEMDMGTEQKKQLNKKWCNYRDYLRSDEFKYNERKIIVLFILDGWGNQENRKKVVEIEAYTVLNSEIDNNFDIYVGTKDEILDLFQTKLLPYLNNNYINHNEIKNLLINKYKYKVASAIKGANQYFSGIEYLYIAKEILEDNIPKSKSFIIDESFYSPFQSLNKICCFNDTNKTNAKLIIVCDSLESMYYRLRQVDLVTQKNIYYTTLDRLRNSMYLHQAIVNFDNLGNIYSFADRELKNIHYESTIKI